MNRRYLLLASLAAATASTWAQVSTFTKPIRIVVPFGPGGVADLTARALGQQLSQQIGQAVIVENRPGAGGIVAADLVAKSAPDGSTLLLMSNGTAVSAGLFKKLPYDTRRDFAPISLVGMFDLALVTAAGSPHQSLAELLAFAKAHPGQLNVGTVNVGSTQNLAAQLLKTRAGIDVQIVPFNGTPALMTALQSGAVDVAVEILSPMLSQITGHRLSALAVLGDEPSPALPQVPTVAQAAAKAVPQLGDFSVSSWNALAAPAQTPKDVVQRLHHEVQLALQNKALQASLAKWQVEARSSQPEQLAMLLNAEINRWSTLITALGIPRQ